MTWSRGVRTPPVPPPDEPNQFRFIQREAAQGAISAYRDALEAQRQGDARGAELLTEVAERLAGLRREAARAVDGLSNDDASNRRQES